MPQLSNPLLIVDDHGLLYQLRRAFSDREVVTASTREEAVGLIKKESIPVAVIDLGLPPGPDGASEGIAALAEIRQIAPATKVIIATENGTRDHALRAVSLGAYDVYKKPIAVDTLRLIVDRAERLFELEEENRRLATAKITSPIEGIIAGSPQMLQVLRNVEKIAPTNVSVLLLGESGTGKELIARALHQRGRRAAGPFVPISCAAIPETLLESELFGYEKGAFTGAVRRSIGKIESTNGGTLFLDEIGDVPLSMQVKLLRFLQNQTIERVGGRKSISVDLRVVSATNQDLDGLMAQGRFREDLYYRLREVVIRIPPLRERTGDSVLLASFFLRRFAAENGGPVPGFVPSALAAIRDYAWPGNVRELENRVKRAVVMAEGSDVSFADLELSAPEAAARSLDIRAARARAERDVIQRALAQTGSNLARAAKLLGISRPTLYDLIREHRLDAAPDR
jgi:two-component system NtrC family response regulator